MKSIIEAAGHRTGLIGTIDYRVGDKVYPAPNTTPESLDLQRLLAEMVDSGDRVLRHGSFLPCPGAGPDRRLRVRGRGLSRTWRRTTWTFTRTMESYFQAKLLLFTGLAADKAAVVNRRRSRLPRTIIAGTKAKVS